MSNLLAQHQEIRRLEKEMAKRLAEDEDQTRREDEEAHGRAVKEFEAAQAGLSKRAGQAAGRKPERAQPKHEEGTRTQSTSGKKRKFEMDEEELLKVAKLDTMSAKSTLREEKVCRSCGSSRSPQL